MRLHPFLLLAMAFLAFVNGISAATSSKLTVLETPAQLRHQSVLRLNTDEERGLVDAAKLQLYKIKLSQLKLDKSLIKVLESPQLKSLSKFNSKRDSAKQIGLVAKLSAKYGDGGVARELVYLQKTSDNPGLQSVLTQLRNEQVANWLEKKLPSLEVANILKFKKDGHSLFRSNALDVLEDYILKRNNPDETLLKTLTAFYGGEPELYSKVAMARFNPRSRQKALEVEKEFLTKLKSDNLEPSEVFKKLSFDDDMVAAIDTGKVDALYNVVGSRGKTLEQLGAKYKEVDVAMRLTRSKGFSAAAGPLQKKQLSNWVDKGMSADDVFTLINFRHGSRFPAKLDILQNFINLRNAKNPEDTTTLLTVLQNGFKDEEGAFALMLSSALKEMREGSLKTTILTYQNSLYEQWHGAGDGPLKIATEVFGVSKTDVATGKFNGEIKAIIQRYVEKFPDA